MMKTITEWCPECEQEVELEDKFIIQNCPDCGKDILPCSICPNIDIPMRCAKCPFEEFN